VELERVRVHRPAGQLTAVGAERVHNAVRATKDDLFATVAVEIRRDRG
jgi:hypothetical protein